MSANLPVRAHRIAADIEALAAITDPHRPYTRRAFTPRFLEGRDHVRRAMVAAGLETRIDAAGNLIGRRAGSEPGTGTIAVGSHTDTVPDGGRFDGVAGVVAGLEIARALRDNGVPLRHDFEVIDCLAEEVSVFGVSCIGSRSIAGVLPPEWLDRIAPEGGDAAGMTLYEGVRFVGGEPERLRTAKRGDLKAFLELHIEQGTVLEGERIDIGVVSAIAGITRIEVIVEGRADHAGTTPMGRRRDALVAASDFVTRLDALARQRAVDGEGHFAATVGEFRIQPNAANVVPSEARLLIDARAELREGMDAFFRDVEGLAAGIAAVHDVTVQPPRVVSDNRPTPSDDGLLTEIEAACDRLGATRRRMASGAGHDMAFFARVAPAAMVFIPCRDGRSHAPEEWAEADAIALGAAVLYETVIAIDAKG
ncbi:Zn-dependent hydrolase [Aureimonas leprariae]|uniref:Zn-dependent hydrolase n=1 Tax=Plantimonas leprariae TaxID=2615207 RepID=A0A7V7PKS8_9HYPH|nr:Zn-dependent hydrolase [Aureimonas leprariae]KAB0676415.1 Zn-dependent hydrolase [Aureimonas leprariae]